MEYHIKDTFVVKKDYKTKDLNKKKIHLAINTILYRLEEYPDILVCHRNNNLIPVCVNNCQNAKDYFVWNNEPEERWNLEQAIFDLAPFSEELMNKIRTDFKHLIREDCTDTIIYNDYFYVGSHIPELKKYREWLNQNTGR